MVTAERTETGDQTAESSAKTVRHPAPGAFSLRLQLPSDWDLTDARFLELCSLNEGWRMEVDGEGGLLIMAPTGPLSSAQGAASLRRFGFGATRTSRAWPLIPAPPSSCPTATVGWPMRPGSAISGWPEIVGDDDIIWRICPDFVVEVRSATDELAGQQEKMEMWVSQGARLGWLVDPLEEAVWIYRPEREAERVERPESVAASEIGDDLVIDFSRIWPNREATPETS